MFDELEKYKENGHFFFNPKQDLKEVCNAPADKSGVYVVYALKGGKIDLVYIGCSGKLNTDGSIFIRKAGLGGIKDRLINGHQFGKIPRRKSWPVQMSLEKIEVLDVYWYVTHNDAYSDSPRILENQLLLKYGAIYGNLPKWNKEL